MTEIQPLNPRVWALADTDNPENGLAHQDAKARFWVGPLRGTDTADQEFLNVTVDETAEAIFARNEQNPCSHKPIQAGDPDSNYDHTLSAHMDHRTPQFNLRNVMRVVLDSDMEFMEWGKHELPDRRGFNQDLREVRAARHDAPDFQTQNYATMALVENQRLTHTIFVQNDWEKWYGEDKKRLAGSLWAYIPADGGRRTRPVPKDMLVTPHKFWKGRMITEDY